MTAVAVIRSSGGGSETEARGKKHPTMTLVPQGKKPIAIPYAPRTSQLDGVVPTFATVERGGRRPLLMRSGGSLQTMSFDLIIAHTNTQAGIEGILGRLRALAASGARVVVNLDATSRAFQWRLTSFSQQIVARQHGSNAATQAVVTMTFTQASDPVVAVGPVTGGAAGGSAGGKRPKFYVWRKGDTFPALAKRFYGDVSLWQELADHNKVRRPKQVKVGFKVRLPEEKVLRGLHTWADPGAGGDDFESSV